MPPFCIIHDQFWARGPEGVWACAECSEREFWHAVSAFLLGALVAEQLLGGAAE